MTEFFPLQSRTGFCLIIKYSAPDLSGVEFHQLSNDALRYRRKLVEIAGKCDTVEMAVVAIVKVLCVDDIVFIVSEAYYVHAVLAPIRCDWLVGHSASAKGKGQRSRSIYNCI